MSSTLHKSEGFQSENLDYAAGKTSGNVFLVKSIAFHTWKLAWKHQCFATFTKENQGRQKIYISAIVY